MGEERDIIDIIQEDHAEFRRLFEQLEIAPADERADLFRYTVERLAGHEAAEEAIVHKALRDGIEDGDRVAESVMGEEASAEELLADMSDMEPSSQEFASALGSLKRDVLAHADHEERDEHPRLRSQIDAERRAEMGRRFQMLRDTGPTRPHPNTPQTPEVRAAAGPLVGVFDRARDAVRDAMKD